MNATENVPAALIAVAALALISVVVLAAFGVARFVRPALAILRGSVQLALLAFVLSGIIGDIRWVALFLGVMFVFAVVAVSGRLGRSPRTLVAAAASMASGAIVSGGILFGSGAIPSTPRYVLAVGGMLIGGSMTVAAVAGRAFASALADRWDQVEGWLALGAPPARATIRIARESAWTGLVPLTDQTRTTGLVVLPGAFVGAVFGGLSPIDAGLFQITVLAALVASGSIVVTVLLMVLGRHAIKPVA